MDSNQTDAAEQAARRATVNDRRVLNGIFWVLRSGAPWRDLPANYGPYTTCYNRFVRWRRAGVRNRIMKTLATAHDASVQMIDTSIVRVHQYGACIIRNRKQSMGRSRGGLTSKMHALVDTNGLPVRLALTAGEAHDNRLANNAPFCRCWPNRRGQSVTCIGRHTGADKKGNAVMAQRAAERAADLAPIIAEIRAAGATSLRAIAAGLNERGIPTARGHRLVGLRSCTCSLDNSDVHNRVLTFGSVSIAAIRAMSWRSGRLCASRASSLSNLACGGSSCVNSAARSNSRIIG
jgi:transposase